MYVLMYLVHGEASLASSAIIANTTPALGMSTASRIPLGRVMRQEHVREGNNGQEKRVVSIY